MASQNFKNPFASGLGKNGRIAAWVVAFAIVVSIIVSIDRCKMRNKRHGWYTNRTEGIPYTKHIMSTFLFYFVRY